MTTASPLSWPVGWPRTPAHQRLSRYQLKATFDVARRKLYDALRRMGVDYVIISCNLELRKDGQHRADKADNALDDPGVAIYFEFKDRPMVMASDRYETVAANLRSVGLAVEYLRGLERHGGGHMMEKAFYGFSALPPPSGASAPQEKPWREVLEITPALEEALGKSDLLAVCERRYREKSKDAHSDAGGDDKHMIVLNAAIAAARADLKS